MGGEDSAEHQDVKLGLVGTDEDSGADGVQVVFRVLNDDVYAGRVFHHELEGSPGSILGRVLQPEHPCDEGHRDAVDSARDEGKI